MHVVTLQGLVEGYEPSTKLQHVTPQDDNAGTRWSDTPSGGVATWLWLQQVPATFFFCLGIRYFVFSLPYLFLFLKQLYWV